MKERIFYRNLSVLMSIVFVLFGVFVGECIKLKTENTKLIEANVVISEDYLKVLEENTALKKKIKSLNGKVTNLEKEVKKLEKEVKKVDLPVYNYTEEEIYLLAQCVEAEAGYYDNHDVSQRYITQVILNRVRSGQFPNNIKDVIYQKSGDTPQFSVAYNGMIDREVELETLANVYSVLIYGTDLPEYVLYFYGSSLTENWVNTLNTYDTIQGTVFAYE